MRPAVPSSLREIVLSLVPGLAVLVRVAGIAVGPAPRTRELKTEAERRACAEPPQPWTIPFWL